MTTSQPSPRVPIVTSVAPLAVATDAWLVDIWGVMHNGVTPFMDAARACSTFRKIGGTVMLLSNAPRPAQSVMQQLQRIGVPDSAYDVILTSGDAARSMIGALGGTPVYHIGPQRDLPVFEGLGVKRVPRDAAEVVVCTGLFDDDNETPDDYAADLDALAARGVRMICANPDLKVERAGKIVWCAGGVAKAYEERGGKVDYAGKPHLPVYDMALARLSDIRGKLVKRERVLAIGDGVKTDIAGASAAGIRSVFVASAIHVDGALDAAKIDALFSGLSMPPVAAMPALAW